MKFTQLIKPGFGKSKYFSGHGENPMKGDKGWLRLTQQYMSGLREPCILQYNLSGAGSGGNFPLEVKNNIN